jgi:hypothetical protein
VLAQGTKKGTPRHTLAYAFLSTATIRSTMSNSD